MTRAADSCQTRKVGGVLEQREALIRLEGLSELDDAGHVLAVVGEVVVAQTVVKACRDGMAQQRRITKTSVAADTCQIGKDGGGRTYSSDVKPLFAIKPSPRYLAASASRLLSQRLQARANGRGSKE